MYCRNESNELVTYEFVGWVKDSTKFMEVMNDDIKMPSDVRTYLLDEIYKQAEFQASVGTKDNLDGKFYYPDYYIINRQQDLENIAKASDQFSNKLWRTKEKQMFIFGPWLGGVYVFKKVS